MKNKYYIPLLLLFLLFLFFACFKKNEGSILVISSKDSLSTYFSLANDFSLPREKRQVFTHKAFDIVVDQENDSLNRVNMFKVANRYYNINDWKDFNKTVHLVLDKSENAKDTINIIKAYTYLGDYYVSQSVSDSAFLFYYKAEKMYVKLGDNFNVGKTLINKATLQYMAGDFLGSEKAVFIVLRIIKNEKQANNILYDAYNLLGIIYGELGEYENAIAYHNKALAISDDEIIPKEFQSRATSYNNIGFLYLNFHKYLLAKNYFKKGLEQNNLAIEKPTIYAMLLDNLAYSKFKLKETEGLPQLFYQSLKLRDSLKLTSGIFINKIHLSEYFASKSDTVKAIKYSKQALLLARNTSVSRDVLVALNQLAIIEPKKEAIYSKEYIRINEELQKAERKMGDKFSRIEYETDVIKDENTDLAAKNRNLLFGFSAFALVGLFLYIIKAQKTKNRELVFKQEQQKVNEEIYNLMISQQNTIETNRVKEKKRVAQELHDGVLGRMFGIRMNLDSLNKIDDETAIQRRNNYLSELKNIEQDIREISHDLNREKSELINNFVAIVDNLLEDQKKTFKPKLIAVIDRKIKWELLSNSSKINLYRIIQESLQNINKYAEANTIKVELKKMDGDLFLTISDDGKGFDINKMKKGIGLQNIQSRTIECNGTVDIQSKKGNGTIITIAVPFENTQILT
ncbi:signal transduction histidine kinase/tetratricopeptide (TPR) repeat protein [Flavobacterium sp. CG_23.5]|uniref:tetratricopeptide repeat-containing sensor histidine kinase n=1 Tax=unclassified Flavobacterium TaxID=196869 RepID=UPI0018CBD191|nr:MULTISPECIES: tetratricopeptide repeat-containing sensor histidine kinase [unclassified Flavobacterium]MBG6109271.1 signal transduction histidine kinase/tetratricopeptide (TPR) repeat protein [Flavobacterium sp. CG_9.10]MBP2283468.1 signal transduction histidine kinase/tetratricopeptide (TPR) repeat protein [Flavobacterium sp. CG_23.5]